MPTAPGVGGVDRDLGVLDPSRGAGVLALHPDGRGALLQVSGLVEHHHAVGVTDVIDYEVTQAVAHSVGVPDRAGQEILHGVRVGVVGVLVDRPAVPRR